MAVGTILLLSGIAIAVSTHGDIDRCLNDGGAWDYRTEQCGPLPQGPVDHLIVDKSARYLWAMRDGKVVREFRVALGRGGLEPKVRQGDGRVPEGRYLITYHNPDSAYHLSLRIGYPTPEQAAAAEARGEKAGGDIMIHGLPNGMAKIGSRHRKADWTEGCIALTNAEIEWLYANVADGTPIDIGA